VGVSFPGPKLDEAAVAAAKEFLLGRTWARDRRTGANDRGERTQTSEPFTPAAPEPPPETGPTLELSATDIRRTDTGWRARCIHKRGVDSRHVNDARYGGYVKSFIEAIDVRDRFCRNRGVPIPWEIEAVVDGDRVAPEVVRQGNKFVVRWQGQEHEVTGADAEEIATEVALDLFVEYLERFLPAAAGPPAAGPPAAGIGDGQDQGAGASKTSHSS
jgi:hypothetical protein